MKSLNFLSTFHTCFVVLESEGFTMQQQATPFLLLSYPNVLFTTRTHKCRLAKNHSSSAMVADGLVGKDFLFTVWAVYSVHIVS